MTIKSQGKPEDEIRAEVAKIKNHYAKGTRFEHKTRDDLIARGWLVMRAAGSKGNTKIDLLAFRPGWPIMMIQCKTSGGISKVEWDQIFKVAGWYGRAAVPILASNGINGRGVIYQRITGERIRYAQKQPVEPFDPGSVDDGPRIVFRPNGADDPTGEIEIGSHVTGLSAPYIAVPYPELH